MKERPKLFLLLALSHFAIAISLPLQIFLWDEHSYFEIQAVLGKLSPMNWVVFALSALNGFLFLRASPILRLTFPLFFISVLWNNWLVMVYGLNFQSWTILASSAFFALFASQFYREEIQSILLRPDKRWWLWPKRIRAKLPVCLDSQMGRSIYTNTFDLSERGAFIPLEQLNRADENTGIQYSDFRKGDRVSLRMRSPKGSELSIPAVIVRKTPARGQYPAGLGLEFVEFGLKHRNYVKSILMAA